MSLNTTAVRIKVILKDVKPEVMRCLVVPLTLRLDRLHLTLQAAVPGWRRALGHPDPDGDFGSQPIDARKAPLSDIVQETGAKTIHYLYDFGDSWEHVIKLEKRFDDTTTEGLSLLLETAGLILQKTSAVRQAMPNTSTPSATLLIQNMKIAPLGGGIWKPRRRVTRSK